MWWWWGQAVPDGDSVKLRPKAVEPWAELQPRASNLNPTRLMAYSLLPSLVHPHGQQAISSVAFDPVSDVLWSGTSLGSVTAHYPSNTPGVRFRATTKGHQVTKIATTEKDVKAVTESGIGAWGKGGVNRWFYP